MSFSQIAAVVSRNVSHGIEMTESAGATSAAL